MQISTLRPHLVESTTTNFRLLVVVLAAIATALGGQPLDLLLVLLGASYVAATTVLWLFAPRLTWTWFVYPIAIIDVGVITAFISLSPATSLPLWSLYLFPLASTAATGRAPAIAAASLSIIGYLSVALLTTGTLSGLAIWQAAVLVAATVLITILTHRWIDERQEKRAWQELAVAARGLGGGEEPDNVAATVAERARRLVRADRAWIWWCIGDGSMRPAVQVGKLSEAPPAPYVLTSSIAHKLDHGVIALDELGEPFANLVGDAVSLLSDKGRLALLSVCWNTPPRDRAMRRHRLRVFAPWAADALAQAQARLASRDKLRLSSILAQAAIDLAGTNDRQAARKIVVDAASDGLKAQVSLVVPSSIHMLATDTEFARTPAPSSGVSGDTGTQIDTSALAARESASAFADPVGENSEKIVLQVDPKPNALAIAWLDRLAELGRIAMERCAEHGRLQMEEQRLRGGLEAVPAPLAIWKASGALKFANAPYLALGLGDTSGNALAPPGASEEEVTIGSPSRVFMAVTTPILGGQYIMSHYREITRERDALRAKDELFAMVGHELRTPLTSILGYSQIMARHLGIVQQQVDRLNHLIGDFAEAAKLQGGQLPLSRERINPVELAQLAAERFTGGYQGRSLRLDLSDTPPVEGDPVRLGQVLDNLLGNAAKYSPVDSEIVLAVGMEAGQVTLLVRDQGVGIAPQHISHVFDRFYRVPSADTDRVRGSGLGLSIVRDIVTAHGGRVWVESAGPGLGSTFRVSLAPPPFVTGTVRLEDRQAS